MISSRALIPPTSIHFILFSHNKTTIAFTGLPLHIATKKAQAVVEITDLESFESWLEDKPPEWAQALAVRAAMRVLPTVGRVFDNHQVSDDDKNNLIIFSFRALTISWAARKYPAHDMVAVADDAAAAANAAADDAYAAAAYAAAYAAYAAAYAVNAAAYAVDAAAYAAAAYAAAAIWLGIDGDADFLQSHTGTAKQAARALVARVLWIDDQGQAAIPQWSLDAFNSLKKAVLKQDGNWQVWTNWYQSRLDGQTSWGLGPKQEKTLMLRIAGQEDDWWKQGPDAVNAAIAGWIDEQKGLKRPESPTPIFLSYSTINEAVAKDVGQMIEDAGFPVIAQYKDMPPGSNFITEMQDGLAEMGRFSPLYSPDYLDSDVCQDEWNAAYNMDRGGRKRKIVGFQIAPCELKPLQNQIVYTKLYNLSKDDAKEAIHHALTWNGKELSRKEGRRVAAISASPQPVANEDGKLGVSVNSAFDSPFLDAELPKLPELMRQRIAAVLEALESRNAPSLVSSSLRDYSTELAINGLAPYIPNLRGLMEIVEAEISDTLGNWHSGGIKVALDQIFKIHAKIIDRFPLDAKRERFIKESPVDPEVFDKAGFRREFEKYLDGLIDIANHGLADEEFARVAAIRKRRYRDIASLREPSENNKASEVFISPEDRVTPAEIKKRFLFQESGFADKMLDRGSKITSLVDSEAGKYLFGLAKRLVEMIWGG